MRRSILSLSLALTACSPQKPEATQGESDTSTADETATLGHSSTPTASGPADADAGPADGGPGDDGPVPTSSDTTPPSPTTSATTTSTSGPAPTTTDVPPPPSPGDTIPIFPEETDSNFIDSFHDLPGDCSVWTEDCPEGQKCMPTSAPDAPTWDDMRCVPLVVDPAPVGAPCVVIGHPTSGLDSCEKHAICWDPDDEQQGTCIPLCVGDSLDHFCKDQDEVCVNANGDVLPVCLPKCEPLLVDCPEGQVCIPVLADFACAPDASGPGGQQFSPCTGGNTCDPGLICAPSAQASQCDPNSDSCCLPLCDLLAPSCPKEQVCKQWFMSVPQHKQVGFCADP